MRLIQKTLIIFSIVGLFLVSCSNPKKDAKTELVESIAALEQKCYNDSDNSYDHKMALKTLNEYQKFIKEYPEDSLSAHYLYLGGQLSKSINLYGEAIHQFETLIKDFPHYSHVANAKFLIGMIYENDIKDTAKARQNYQEFIEQYPTDDLVDDAQFLIQNLSLTDEQLIQLLESKSKNDSIM